ncbi:alpha/beta hydrolase [Picosynechococcus sp. PCC 11901]|uniref:alpha/beta fold hydrolase n=1 Tax=Picosynechococcus sp. PCC 11901 TaxID=2579791 RepID=UPI0010FC15F8|nr:alpha/beta hydrolase [Picosynechococcus sp. PCC 11901]QCS49859.1 alpha/beta hydrolase [Picosynechococcus sp. PCC 11901]
MYQTNDVLWLNVNPAFKSFDIPLLKVLAKKHSVHYWEYQQSMDEARSLDDVLVLLHDYLKQCDRPVHLLGHGTGGLVALLYGDRHPERVKSLTLLSVGAYPAVDWQAHYYAQLRLLPCPRSILLKQTVYNLFGIQPPATVYQLRDVLESDLKTALPLHTLCRNRSLPPRSVSMPLLVCGGSDDVVIDQKLQTDWQPWLKPEDTLWQCPQGRYFFHCFYPEKVAHKISTFLQLKQSALTATV